MHERAPARLILLLVTAAVICLSVSAVALAGKPSGGTRATLAAAPNPVATWSTYQLSGCGYAADRQINLVITEPGSTSFYPVAPDSSGCFSISAMSNGAGTYKIEAYQNLSGRNKQTLMGATSLSVS